MRYFFTLAIAALIQLNGHAATDDLDWQLARDRDGITVYTRKVEGSKFKAVKSTMVIHSSLSALVGLVQDAEACPKWAALCKSAKAIEVVSPTEQYVYTMNDLPWPVSDRDAVAHVRWQQDPASLVVTMRADIVTDKLDPVKGTVRIPFGKTSWTFVPRGDGEIEIVSRAHIDPGGATPAWLTNRLLVDSPFDTMVAMREQMNGGDYADATFEFISEP